MSKRIKKPSGAKPVLRCIKYGAKWCGPCRAFEPVFEKFAAAHPDLSIERLDVDHLTPAQDHERIELFGDLMSIPTTVFVGVPPTVKVPGAVTLRELEEAFAKLKWRARAAKAMKRVAK